MQECRLRHNLAIKGHSLDRERHTRRMQRADYTDQLGKNWLKYFLHSRQVAGRNFQTVRHMMQECRLDHKLRSKIWKEVKKKEPVWALERQNVNASKLHTESSCFHEENWTSWAIRKIHCGYLPRWWWCWCFDKTICHWCKVGHEGESGGYQRRKLTRWQTPVRHWDLMSASQPRSACPHAGTGKEYFINTTVR